MSNNRFSLIPEQCPLCKAYDIHNVIIQGYDFTGILVEEKKMCRSCNATFDRNFQVETINQFTEIADA